jgi:localization factor PodJL
MKFGVPWSVKKIRPEAREIAEQAARRSGLSLADWLNSVILQQAGQAGVASPPLTDDAFHGGELEAVNHRLDRLSQRIDQLTRTGPADYGPKHSRESEQLPVAAPLAAPDMPNVQMPPSLDRALAEIAARQRTLSGRASPPRRQPPVASEAPLQPALPAQNLSGLEEQLRNITNQIETLRKPGVEAAINALREELAEIGRTLAEAMPRRALEAIERQIQSLDQRLESRQAGIDADVLVGIEHGLAEIRDAMHGLMPAENLIGYTDAVANLAHKIDHIVAQNDPATIVQLEHAITTLRELSNHIASNDTVRALSAQVHELGGKIDAMAQGGGSDGAFNHLEQRIAMLSDTLAERAHDGGAVSPRLESLIETLAERIDQLQHAPSPGTAFGHLEDYIVKLVEKLDASDARLGHLEGIERGLADLLLRIEDMRANTNAGGLRAQEAPDVDHMRIDLARTQDTLDAVHGTLGHVVDRLATIERDIRERPRQQAAVDSAGALTQQPAYVDDAPSIAAPMAPSVAPIAPPTQRRMSPAAQLPGDPDLPDNQPLEPGSGRPQGNPAARIAASEAALGGAAPAAAPGGKSSFIAAARRAAQAAGQQPNPRAQRHDPAAPFEAQPSLRGKLMKRVKSLFIAASIIAIVVGLVQIAGTVFDFGSPLIKLSDAPASVPVEEIKTADVTAPEPAPEATGSLVANPLAPPSLPPIASPPPVAGGSVIAINPPPAAYQMPPAIPSLFGPPVFEPRADITGSIPRPAAASQPARPPAPAAPATPASTDRLPAAIGGPKLRNAAIAGDAAAAYAVALRFAEGRGVPVNLEEAAHWYERAASKGLVPAQFRYASLWEKGLGVKKDLAQARRLYLAAASKGNSKAMHNLAVLYAEGIDGKIDYGTAVQWFRKAAQHGIADSQYNLGVLCARGLGTDKNYAEAYKWFALAAAQGDSEAAKKRDDVASQLDAAALAAAEQAVKSFVAEQQPQDAVTVREPPGGWDHAAGTPAQASPRTGPLALDALQTGKR